MNLQKKSDNNLTPCNKNRILIVDDDRLVRRTFRIIVSSELPECEMDMAGDGTEAVELFRESHHDIVILDVYLPIMGGLDAYRQIEKECESRGWQMPSIIFCSGFQVTDEAKEIMAKHPEYYIMQKPVTGSAVAEVLKQIVKV